MSIDAPKCLAVKGSGVRIPSAPRRTGGQHDANTINKITFDPVRYDGHLIVTDSDALTRALVAGIGPAKAYGCGLLSLAPPHSN